MKRLKLILVMAAFLIIASCGDGSTSGGVDTSGGVGSSVGASYYGTITYSGVNTCGRYIPGSGNVYIVITSDGSTLFDPVGLSWGYPPTGGFNFSGSVQGSKIRGSVKCINNACTNSDGYFNDGYTYKIDGRINDGGSTVSGVGYIEGTYGNGCYEQFEGAFAATRTN